MAVDFKTAAREEHGFWLQVLGDHARFIHESLAPVQEQEITLAAQFISVFDSLLAQVSSANPTQLSVEAEAAAKELREFKLHLIREHLVGKIKIHLSPTFINHMVNELDEYLRILEHLKAGKVPPVFHEVHHHLLWLLDAAGHSDAIATNLDAVEKNLRAKSKAFMKQFEAFYMKAVEMAGYLRTNVTEFPALRKFNTDTQLEITLFQQFLLEIEELRLSKEALGTFAPLMADHMFREECYYLQKLSQAANTKQPDCNPARPRLKE